MLNPFNGEKLNSQSAFLVLKVSKIIEKYFRGNKSLTFLLSLSGGADSTALAVIFKIIATSRHYRLHATHIDHGLRADSAADALFTGDLCQKLDIPLNTVKLDILALAGKSGQGIEEAGRIARYSQLRKDAAVTEADAIVLAHHSGDLCEDIAMRLTRGAAWPALGGMRVWSNKIFRPLLWTEPGLLRRFLTMCKIPWREDSSNTDLSYQRNRFRHCIMPLLLRENPAVFRQAVKLNRLAEIDRTYFETQLDRVFISCQCQEDSILMPRNLLLTLPEALRMRLYARVFSHMRKAGLHTQLETDTLFRLDAAFMAKINGKKFQFPGDIVMMTQKNGILAKKFRRARRRE